MERGLSGYDFYERGLALKKWRVHMQYLLTQTLESLDRDRVDGDIPGLWSQVRPQLTSLVNRTWQRLAHHGEILDARPQVSTQKELERRGQGRVTVHMLSQFFSKTHTVAGEGEVRDLSPSGCRITSHIRIAPGTAVECWIYPQDGRPFAVDEATVQWAGHREFGLRFSNVRLSVQRQITDMC